jgi:5-methylcytosine-specific restriction endonuclease McrA
MKAPQHGPGSRKASYEIQRASLWRRGYRHCYYCEIRLTMARGQPHSMTLDHKIPLALGGRNKPENYVAACLPCNNAKGSMTEAEFYRWRRKRPA